MQENFTHLFILFSEFWTPGRHQCWLSCGQSRIGTSTAGASVSTPIGFREEKIHPQKLAPTSANILFQAKPVSTLPVKFQKETINPNAVGRDS